MKQVLIPEGRTSDELQKEVNEILKSLHVVECDVESITYQTIGGNIDRHSSYSAMIIYNEVEKKKDKDFADF
jgi:hypothetical protein